MGTTSFAFYRSSAGASAINSLEVTNPISGTASLKVTISAGGNIRAMTATSSSTQTHGVSGGRLQTQFRIDQLGTNSTGPGIVFLLDREDITSVGNGYGFVYVFSTTALQLYKFTSGLIDPSRTLLQSGIYSVTLSTTFAMEAFWNVDADGVYMIGRAGSALDSWTLSFAYIDPTAVYSTVNEGLCHINMTTFNASYVCVADGTTLYTSA